MDVQLQAKRLVQLNVKKKAFTKIIFASGEVIAHDKYRFQCSQSVLKPFYSQTIAFAVSSNGEHAVVVASSGRLITIILRHNTIVSNCSLPENLMRIIKQSTNFTQIGFFTSHIAKHSYLQENDLQCFISWQGECVAFLTSKLLITLRIESNSISIASWHQKPPELLASTLNLIDSSGVYLELTQDKTAALSIFDAQFKEQMHKARVLRTPLIVNNPIVALSKLNKYAIIADFNKNSMRLSIFTLATGLCIQRSNL